MPQPKQWDKNIKKYGKTSQNNSCIMSHLQISGYIYIYMHTGLCSCRLVVEIKAMFFLSLHSLIEQIIQ